MQHLGVNDMTTLNKSQQRDLSKTLPMIAHLGKDFGARALSALYRSAMKASQQNEILAIAVAYGVVSSEEFIIG
jgi:hypothetical protein